MPCCSRGGKKVRNDPRILEEFAKFRPGLLARSIDLHYEPLLSLSSSSTAPLLSALVHREGKRLLAPFQRGRKKDSMESLSIDERTNGARSSIFPPFSERGTTPLGAKGSHLDRDTLLSLSVCLFRATSLANRRLILASMHRSTSRTSLFHDPFLPILYTPSSRVSTLFVHLLEKKKKESCLVSLLSAFRKI